MQKEKSISVIMPVFNCERYLAEAIESVLSQTYPAAELIVVDDGSTDKSAEIANRYKDKLRYVYQRHSGLAPARNRGIESAGGDFFAFLDADDLWAEDKLSRQVAIFDERPELDMAFAHIKQFYSPELKHDLKDKYYFPEIMQGYSATSMLVKRESFFRVGLFDLSFRIGEFIDWYLKASEMGLKSFMSPDVLVKRRIHDANIGICKRDSRGDYVKIIKSALDRRREKESALK